ncbi:hypothetical protein BJ508DRAFT_332024 [Ascobolus immersus RN42]|uniref:Uncharacterized protein n=1 Tax=Ascobolus immersus RN42 TaxID=1160509 RepID=A0A3N4HNV6_ASCIM|nr:hypothetical protein BJ508DRAFT_332024 [Ascobolus immersus RN42]
MPLTKEQCEILEERHRVFEKIASETTTDDAKPGTFFLAMVLDDVDDPNDVVPEQIVRLVTPIDMTLDQKNWRIPRTFVKTMNNVDKLLDVDFRDLDFFYKGELLKPSTVLSELDEREDMVCIVVRMKEFPEEVSQESAEALPGGRPESREIGPEDLDSTDLLLQTTEQSQLLQQHDDAEQSMETTYDNNAAHTYDADDDETAEQSTGLYHQQSGLERQTKSPPITSTPGSAEARPALQSLMPNSLDSQSNSTGTYDIGSYNNTIHNQDSSEKENVLETIGLPPLSQDKRFGLGDGQVLDKRRVAHDTGSALEGTVVRQPTIETEVVDAKNEVNADESPIHRSFRTATMDNLEMSLQAGRDALLSIKESLQKALASGKHEDMERDMTRYVKEIDTTVAKTHPPPTIIGVVGDTGAGKSSVINALLEEEQLVPTSGMRACTAVVTEISYNRYTPQTREPYRAEIEFVSLDDWVGEVKLLYRSLQEDSKRKTSGLSEDAEIAASKLKAVYPHKFANGESILAYELEEFFQDEHVNNLLSSIHTVKKQRATDFYNAIKEYVDSVSHRQNGRTVEYWPLIKVVRVYVRSEVLKSGAVIVDLPGVHDQNAGRSAVAERYMRKCTGYWIVAPISRAVDSKTAKTVLGEAFKRQVVMDGLVENTTFICSMTDNIVNSEIYKALPDLQRRLEREETIVEELEIQHARIDDKIESLDKEIEKVGKEVDRLDEEIDEWENMRDRDNLCFPLSLRKRKRRGDSPSVNPKRRRDTVGSDEASQSEADSSDEYGPSNPSKRISSREELSSHLDTLRDLKRQNRATKTKLTGEKNALKSRKLDLKQQIQSQKNAITRQCIKARNDWSREQLKKNFAIGLKEADDTAAELADPENFDPDIEIRDYDACRRNFPVFCVSSRGYHRLRGRMKRESDNMPFDSPEQTEFPALQAHCISVTERPRRTAAIDFGVSFEKLVNSLSIWISNDDDRLGEGTMDERQIQSVAVENSLTEMKEEYRALAQKSIVGLQRVFDTHIYKHFEAAIQSACSAAHQTVDRWKAQYKWNTFKATCKQKGNGNIRMNEELAEPLTNSLSTDWEKCFQTEVPQLLEKNRHGMTKILKRHYQKISGGVKAFGLNQRQEQLLRDQARTTEQKCGTVTSHINALVSGRQREISREFAPEIQKVMEPAYAACVDVTGAGTFDRMKNVLHDHLQQHKEKMFTLCTKALQKELQNLEGEVLLELEKMATDIHDHFYNDLETFGILPVGAIAVRESRPKKKHHQKPAVKSEIELILTGLLDLVRATAEGAPDPSEIQLNQDLDKTMQSAIMGSQTLLNDDGPNLSRLLESPAYVNHPYGKLLKAVEAKQSGSSSQDARDLGMDSIASSSQYDFTINEVVDSEYDSSEELVN